MEKQYKNKEEKIIDHENLNEQCSQKNSEVEDLEEKIIDDIDCIEIKNTEVAGKINSKLKFLIFLPFLGIIIIILFFMSDRTPPVIKLNEVPDEGLVLNMNYDSSFMSDENFDENIDEVTDGVDFQDISDKLHNELNIKVTDDSDGNGAIEGNEEIHYYKNLAVIESEDDTAKIDEEIISLYEEEEIISLSTIIYDESKVKIESLNLKPGKYHVQYVAEDKKGNKSETDLIPFQLNRRFTSSEEHEEVPAVEAVAAVSATADKEEEFCTGEYTELNAGDFTVGKDITEGTYDVTGSQFGLIVKNKYNMVEIPSDNISFSSGDTFEIVNGPISFNPNCETRTIKGNEAVDEIEAAPAIPAYTIYETIIFDGTNVFCTSSKSIYGSGDDSNDDSSDVDCNNLQITDSKVVEFFLKGIE